MMIDLELADKPEVHQIAAKLELDPDIVVGKLIRVWAWFDKQTTDGNARSVNAALVNRLASHNGFAEAMSEAGWLDESKTGLKMPNFDRWNGKSAKKRALAVRRVQRWRDADVNAGSVTKSLPEVEKRREQQGASAFALPDWVSRDDWKAFEDSRKKLRKPMTDRARSLVINELDRLRAAGNDPSAVLAQSVRKGWQDVFPLKDNGRGGENVSPLYRREGPM